MKSRYLRAQIFTGFIQLLLVITAVTLGYQLTRHFSIIPKAVLHLPDVYVSHSDMWNVVKIFTLTFLFQIVISSIKYKTAAFNSIARFANEYVWYLFAYTTASLYLFLATTINYDPQFIAAIGLVSSLLYLVVFSVSLSFSSQLDQEKNQTSQKLI